MSRLRKRLSYANVMATLATFIALGGTSYAVATLPRNSVGGDQIRRGAVGPSEIRSKAVRSRDIRDRSVALRDISTGARNSLRGQAGPPGPQGPAGASAISFHASIASTGVKQRGNATSSRPLGTGRYLVTFARNVSQCDAVAGLAAVPGGTVVEPPAGRATVRPNAAGIEVRTFDVDGTARDLPFTVLVGC